MPTSKIEKGLNIAIKLGDNVVSLGMPGKVDNEYFKK